MGGLGLWLAQVKHDAVGVARRAHSQLAELHLEEAALWGVVHSVEDASTQGMMERSHAKNSFCQNQARCTSGMQLKHDDPQKATQPLL